MLLRRDLCIVFKQRGALALNREGEVISAGSKGTGKSEDSRFSGTSTRSPHLMLSGSHSFLTRALNLVRHDLSTCLG